MSRRGFGLVVLVLALFACKKHEFKPLTSSEGGFSVEMPGEPKHESKSTETAAGPIQFQMYSVELSSGSVAYIVSYNDYPKALVTFGKPDSLLDGVVEGAVGKGRTVKSQRNVALEGHPGREFTAVLASGHDYSSRVFLVKERLYQLNVVSEPGKGDEQEKLRFFDSFKLLPR
jgi:hypothetical protein